MKLPEIKEFTSLSLPDCSVVDFAPGVRLHLLDAGQQPANRISVYFNRGVAANDVPGAASLMPKLLQEGTATMSGAEIADTLDFNGAWLRANISEHYSGLSLISLNETTGSLLPLLGDMLLRPSFPDNALETQRRNALMKTRTELTKPSFVAGQEFTRRMAGTAHPYLYKPEPQFSQLIEGVTRDDIIRAHELALHTPVNIFAAGQLTDEVMKAVEELAARLVPTDTSAIVPIVPMSPLAPEDVIIVSETAEQQAAVRCGKPTVARADADYDELRHAVIALGGYFGSRLMTNIREEKGLTYGIYASLNGAQEGAYLNISAQCDNAYAQRVVTEIKHEMDVLGSTLMDEDELRRLRAEITSKLAARLDSPFSIIDYYESNLIVDIKGDYFRRQFETIRSLTPERLREIAARHLNPEGLTTVIVKK